MTLSKSQMKALDAKKRELLEKRRELTEGLPFLYGHKWYEWQRSFFKSEAKMTLMTCANQVGKALEDGTLVPTPDGFKRIADLKIGDFVFGRDGKMTRIIDIPFKGITPCVEFTFDDGSTVVSSEDHLWVCKTGESRFRKECRGKPNLNHDQWQVMTTRDVVQKGGYSPETYPRRRITVPFCEAPEYGRKDLFDPYLVGLAIGNGGLSVGSVVITTADPFVRDYMVTNYRAHLNSKYGYLLPGLVPTFRALGLMGKTSPEKRIPSAYLEASVSERKELLAGLMDTDGSIFGKCAMEYCTTSEGLKDDFIRLVYSLGGTCKVIKRPAFYKDGTGQKIQCHDAYRIRPKFAFNPFKSPTKGSKWYEISRRHEKILYEAKHVGAKRATCITVDNDDGTFLCTDKYIVTHNSVSHIWRIIDWATDVEKWPLRWQEKPNLFWFFYTDQDTLNREFALKWTRWLPQGKYKDHPVYGWKLNATKNGKEIESVEFNSGILLEFKLYTQDPKNLQSATVFYVGGDEEIPERFWDEIIQRTSGPDGYFSAAFTATLNQQMWWRAMEGKGENELFPDAWKRQVSKYDCILFDDGTPGLYTEERVKKQEAMCSSQTQIDRRIMGRFAAEVGRKYYAYDPNRHFIKPRPIGDNWLRWGITDHGHGGAKNHPAAMLFIAVRPDMRLAYVYKGRRMDNIETTSGDLFLEYIKIRGGDRMTRQLYDYHAKDFGLIAERAGEPFDLANKSHTEGEDIVNTLLENGMLFIFDDPELNKLGTELMTVMKGTDKRKAGDDMADCLRYGCIDIPWDWTAIQGLPTEGEVQAKKALTEKELLADEIRQRRGDTLPKEDDGWAEYQEEIAYWDRLANGEDF